ncbi:MAG: MFS transporter [Brumimicrobium sp.]
MPLKNKELEKKTVYSVLFALSAAHFLNDSIQTVIPSIYPLLQENYALSFTQIGFITLSFQMTASILQPMVGAYTDKHPQPFSLAIGMGFSLVGLISLAFATSFYSVLIAVSFVGMGSSIFHPESSRMARLASGNRPGLAQSIFQVGGNTGAAFGPLLAAAIVVTFGQRYLATFSILALIAIIILIQIGKWYVRQDFKRKNHNKIDTDNLVTLPRKKVIFSIFILFVLIFSKYFYMSSIQNYFTFYMMGKFDVSVRSSQIFLFVFLFAIAAGTLLGGYLGDKFGRKKVIWVSILGVAPFTLILPYVGLVWTIILIAIIGIIIASAFPAIIVYAQEIIPHKLGMISGMFYGLAFGMGAIASAVLGMLADFTSIYFVFQVCAFLPLLGLVAGLLPKIEK